MYSVVLMAALSTSPAVPDWGRHGCNGCYGAYSCYGYGGSNGCSGSGCWGGYGYGCSGCWGRGYYSYPAYVSLCTGYDGPYGYGTYYGGYGFGPYYPAYVTPPGSQNPTTRPPEKIPGPAGDGKEQASTASFTVDLPTGAKLYVDGQPMEANSPAQTFNSPALASGQVYAYTFRAEVVRDGQTKSESQRVLFRSGETVRVAFPELTGSGTLTAQAGKR